MTERGATVTEIIDIKLDTNQWASYRLRDLSGGLERLRARLRQLEETGVRDIKLSVVENFGSLRFTFSGILP